MFSQIILTSCSSFDADSIYKAISIDNCIPLNQTLGMMFSFDQEKGLIVGIFDDNQCDTMMLTPYISIDTAIGSSDSFDRYVFLELPPDICVFTGDLQ